jgi:hypothetical protein
MITTVLMFFGVWLLVATFLGISLGRLMAAHEVSDDLQHIRGLSEQVYAGDLRLPTPVLAAPDGAPRSRIGACVSIG